MTTFSFFAQNFLLPALAGVLGLILLRFLTQISLKKSLLIALTVSLAAFLVSLSVSWHRAVELRLVVAGTVVDEATNSGIGQALVSLSDGGRSSCTSEDNGNFLMDLTGQVKESQRIRIRVTKHNYKPFDGTVVVPTRDFVVPLRHL